MPDLDASVKMCQRDAQIAAPRPGTIGPIGLDAGARGLRLLQLRRTPGGGWTVAAAAHQPWPERGGRNRFRDQVRKALESAPFSGRRVVAAVPFQSLQIRTVRVAATAGGDFNAAALAEAAGLFPFDPRDAVFQCLPAWVGVEGDERPVEAMILAAPKRAIDDRLRELHAAGLIVASLDAEPCALFRIAVASDDAPDGDAEGASARAILDIGPARTTALIGRGGRPSFIKAIDIGADLLDRAVAEALDMTPGEARVVRFRVAAERELDGAGAISPSPGELRERRQSKERIAGKDDAETNALREAVRAASRRTIESVARQMAMFLRYHAVKFRGAGPTALRLTGPEADDAMLRESLSALLGLPVIPADAPFDLAPGATPGAERGLGALWAAAAGLALKRVGRAASAEEGAGQRRACA